MSQVFVISGSDYSVYRVLGVCYSRVSAEVVEKAYSDSSDIINPRIDEFEVDQLLDSIVLRWPVWAVYFSPEGVIHRAVAWASTSPEGRSTFPRPVPMDYGDGSLYVEVAARDEAHAREVATDKRQAYLDSVVVDFGGS